jgi:hypothetical protein
VSEARLVQAPWEDNAHAPIHAFAERWRGRRGKKRQRVSDSNPPKRSRVP